MAPIHAKWPLSFKGAAHLTRGLLHMLGYQTKQEHVPIPGTLDLIIQSLLDRQQYDDPRGEAAAMGLTSAAWPLFGLLLPRLGLLLALPLLVLMSSLAGDAFHWRDALLSAVVLTAGGWLVFIQGLGLVIPVWPIFIPA